MLESGCPFGMLTVSMTMLTFHNQENMESFQLFPIAKALLRHFAFHAPERLVNLMDTFNRDAAVAEAERRADHYAPFLPLGRPWYEMSFIGVIESDWPIFGLLDFFGRLLVQLDRLYDGQDIVRRPILPCRLERSTDSEELVLKMDTSTTLAAHSAGAARPETLHLVQDATMCGLLGSATLRFHEAEKELRRQQWEASERYVLLKNWTASCRSRGSLGPQAKSICSAASLKSCAALDSSKRRVSQACLKIYKAPGRSLLLRHRYLPLNSRAAALIKDGEQLLRTAINRYGLFVVLWTINSPGFAGDGVPGAFGILQSVQDGFHSERPGT